MEQTGGVHQTRRADTGERVTGSGPQVRRPRERPVNAGPSAQNPMAFLLLRIPRVPKPCRARPLPVPPTGHGLLRPAFCHAWPLCHSYTHPGHCPLGQAFPHGLPQNPGISLQCCHHKLLVSFLVLRHCEGKGGPRPSCIHILHVVTVPFYLLETGAKLDSSQQAEGPPRAAAVEGSGKIVAGAKALSLPLPQLSPSLSPDEICL